MSIAEKKVREAIASGTPAAWTELRNDTWGAACLFSYIAHTQSGFRDACTQVSIDLDAEYTVARGRSAVPVSAQLRAAVDELLARVPWYDDAVAMALVFDGMTPFPPVLISQTPPRWTHVVGWATQRGLSDIWAITTDVTLLFCAWYNTARSTVSAAKAKGMGIEARTASDLPRGAHAQDAAAAGEGRSNERVDVCAEQRIRHHLADKYAEKLRDEGGAVQARALLRSLLAAFHRNGERGVLTSSEMRKLGFTTAGDIGDDDPERVKRAHTRICTAFPEARQYLRIVTTKKVGSQPALVLESHPREAKLGRNQGATKKRPRRN